MRAHGHVNRTGQGEALPATAAVIMAGDDVLPTRLGCRRKKSLIFFHHTNAALTPDDNNVQPRHRGFTPNLCSPTQHDTVQSERKKNALTATWHPQHMARHGQATGHQDGPSNSCIRCRRSCATAALKSECFLGKSEPRELDAVPLLGESTRVVEGNCLALRTTGHK